MTYSSSMAIGRQRFNVRNQNTTSFRAPQKTLGPVSNTIVLIILSCLLGLLYLTQVTKTSSLNYRINDLKERQTSLKSEQANLEIDSARLQALERVKNSQTNQQLVSISPQSTIR